MHSPFECHNSFHFTTVVSFQDRRPMSKGKLTTSSFLADNRNNIFLFRCEKWQSQKSPAESVAKNAEINIECVLWGFA